MKRSAVFVSFLLLAVTASRATAAPDWLTEADGRTAPPGSGRCDAVVLHDEQVVQIPAKGRIIVTTRWALRVVTRDGAARAVASVGYVRGSSEVRGFRAWMLSSAGKVLQQWDRSGAADVSDIDEGQLYTELRHLGVVADAIQPGQTFAYEAVTEADPLFAQWQWWFRSSSPCALSHFELRMPPGLEVSVRSAHLDSARTSRDPERWVWEMRDQPAQRSEALTPLRPDIGPYLCVQVLSPVGDRSSAGLAFRGWPAASSWIAELAAQPGNVTPVLAARAREIGGGAPDTLARIAALARYVQNLNYAALDLNIGRGWGYRPHDPETVLRAGYGDCKDKANLLCSLLRAVGSEAWLMPVYSASRDRIDTSWASPQQFNHCIVAIRVPVTYRGACIADGPHGRLLAFDPTDPLTVLGDLPRDQQGAWGLLVCPVGGGLVRLPVQPAERNGLERRIDAALDPTGRLTATLAERSEGQVARDERDLRRRKSRVEYQRDLEAWLPSQGGGVEIRSWSAAEDSAAGRFQLKVEYDSPSFARTVGREMLTFRSALVSPRQSWAPDDTTRTTPIALAAEFVAETLTVRLPAGFGIDERPQDRHAASDLGRLDATWTERDGALWMIRRWEVRPMTVGPERWREVRALYGALRATNEATVVLIRR